MLHNKHIQRVRGTLFHLMIAVVFFRKPNFIVQLSLEGMFIRGDIHCKVENALLRNVFLKEHIVQNLRVPKTGGIIIFQ